MAVVESKPIQITDAHDVHVIGDEVWPVGILGAKPKPRPCQVACPYCRARQDAKGHPARCEECGRMFGKTAPIQRRG